jgi:hypothetical protein
MRLKARSFTRTAIAAATIATSACAESGRPAGPAAGSKLFVDSNPRGANIVIDGQLTTRATPDTVRDLTDEAHAIGARLERGGVTYSWTAHVERNALNGSVLLPLLARCPSVSCLVQLSAYRTAGTIRYATNPAATLFFTGTTPGGLLWPATSRNSYAAIGSPIFAAKAPVGISVGLGVYSYTVEYPVPYWSGRPPTGTTAGAPGPSQTIWVVPPPYFTERQTVRGLEISWNVIERAEVADALLIRVVFRNISNLESYRAADPLAAERGGFTYDSAYIGFAIDPDIGVPTDDYVSYAPDLSSVFAYDSDFREFDFSPNAQNPALLGLRLLQAPGTARVVLNSWPIALQAQPLDWFLGNGNEWFGWDMMSRRQSILPYQSADPRIGFVPNSTSDYRMSVSMGPFRIAPGDSAILNVAVAVALPVAGTYATGVATPPGDPASPVRPIMATAAALLNKLREVDALLR